MENRRERRTTDTLGARAITLCSCSTSSVTARGRCSVRGTYIARTSGVMYWIRSCPATGRQECGDTFARTPHSPSRTSMGTWRRGTSFTPNPPKDTDGRREDSGRVGEGATGEMAGLIGVDWRSANGLQSPPCAPMALCGSCDARDGERIRSRELSRTGVARVCREVGYSCRLAVRRGVEWLAAGPWRE